MDLYKPLKNIYYMVRQNADTLLAVTVLTGITAVALWDLGVFSYRNREPVKWDIPVPQSGRTESITPSGGTLRVDGFVTDNPYQDKVELSDGLELPIKKILPGETNEITGGDYFDTLSEGQDIGIREILPFEEYPGWKEDLLKNVPELGPEELERIIKESKEK